MRLTAAYDRLVRDYEEAKQQLLDACETILSVSGEHLDTGAFQAKLEAVRWEMGVNVERLQAKLKEPSSIVDLVPLTELLNAMGSLIASANARIRNHNQTIANIEEQRGILSDQVWKYLADAELKSQLDAYIASRQAQSVLVQKLRSSIEVKTGEHTRIEREIQSLEEQVTDVRQVLNNINGRLRSFGFRGFSLRATPDGKGYEVIRPDGSPARENLSEGERSFVTFLYFYHLIDGSHDVSGSTSNKVVVFDDPVSSMDSEVLFIVSTLIRSVCDRALRGDSHIRQVFVLTHNVYFHKEVTYGRGKAREKKGHAFWTVRKPDTETCVDSHGAKNPITTSYQLLWDELGKDPPSPATIQNNIRRILEYYFQLLAGTRLKSLPNEFSDDDPDKATCMSMVSWIHDGSHLIADDIVYSAPDAATVKKYLRVFRRIFVETGHISHYLMMCSDEMRADYEADALRAARGAVEDVSV